MRRNTGFTNLAVAQKKLDDMQKSELWGKLKAAKNGHVYMLDNPTWSLGTFPLGKEKALEMVRDMVLKKIERLARKKGGPVRHAA
ncbi:hypothetical protein NDS46_21370 [Paenibacillus thiaminolyticus]|uniref:hypothetical protein n=1 Tax=Paenibacillus thiaminolyticus TaxID=49283 RepID=UPI00232DE6B8|nr:hypothetical protein [Paenibacillus thiaminolyticus]WCF06873.1 hypothetical protein NDS46_21370 [Paenibacillus thiaminolyticus]